MSKTAAGPVQKHLRFTGWLVILADDSRDALWCANLGDAHPLRPVDPRLAPAP